MMGVKPVCPIPKLEVNSCQLSVAAYSTYLQIPSVSGGHFYPQTGATCHGNRTHLTLHMMVLALYD